MKNCGALATIQTLMNQKFLDCTNMSTLLNFGDPSVFSMYLEFYYKVTKIGLQWFMTMTCMHLPRNWKFFKGIH